MKDWKEFRLGDVVDIYRGGSPRPIEDYITNLNDGVNWIKIGDVSPASKFIEQTAEKIKPSGVKFSREVHKGDFILSNSMSFGRPYILNVDGCIHDGWLVIQNYQDTFDTDFLYYILSSNKVMAQYILMAAGSSVQNLNKEKVAEVTVTAPISKLEQSRIASALSEVDAFLLTLDKVIAKKQAIKEGTMQQLLSGKIRLKGFNGEWETFSIGKDCVVKARIGWQGLTTAEYLDHGDYGLITGTDIKDGKVKWDTCHFVEKERYVQDPYIIVKPYDVLITKDGTIGKVAVVDKVPFPSTLNSGVFVVRSKNDKLSQRGLSLAFLSAGFDDFIRRLTAGSTIVHLYQKDIVNFEFKLPPSKEEQLAIVSFMESMDSELIGLQKKRKKYEDIKQGMMQQLLTGRIRLIEKK